VRDQSGCRPSGGIRGNGGKLPTKTACEMKSEQTMRIRRIGNERQEVEHGRQRQGMATATWTTAVLTEADAAVYIGMSRAWLNKSRTRRFRNVADALPFIRAGARQIVYRREDLDRWLERHLEQVGPHGEDRTAETHVVST
jgi:hypothetical protein